MGYGIRIDRQILIGLKASGSRALVADQTVGGGEEDLAGEIIDVDIHYIVGKQRMIFRGEMHQLFLTVLAHQEDTGLVRPDPLAVGTVHCDSRNLFVLKQNRDITILL